MPSSYSTILRLEKQATGENQGTWGTKLNTVIDLVEAAIAGSVTINTTGGTVTLTTNNSSADQARCMILQLVGDLASSLEIVIPNKSKIYVIATFGMDQNGFDIKIKTAGSGAVAELDDDEVYLVWCDGNDGVGRVTKTAFQELVDVDEFDGNALKLVRINEDEDGLEYVSPAEQEAEFDSGVGIMFGMASPPSGWTQDTSISDRMLRVTNGSGNGTGGTWTISGLSVGSTTLSTSQIPSHNHTYTLRGSNFDNAESSSGNHDDVWKSTTSTSTGSAGSGSSHNHSASADGNWRPAYYNVIRATKN